MDNPLFLIPIIVGPLIILAGVILWKFPPKKINMIYGYRTLRSFKNQEQWDFAQRCAAAESIKFGIILTLTSILGLIITTSELMGLIFAIGIMIINVVIMIVKIERSIKLKFEHSPN